MRVKSVEISNFRSIRQQTIAFNDKCLILVGKNEAGKSNILKAIAGGLDSYEYKITPKDKRKRLPTEHLEDKDYHIKYIFNLESDELDAIFNELYSKYAQMQIHFNGEALSVRDLILQHFNQGLWRYDMVEASGYAQYYVLPKNTKILNKLYEVTKDFTDDAGKTYATGSIIDFEKTDCTVEITLEKLTKEITGVLLNYIKETRPDVYLWNYRDEYLLPNNVAIEAFKAKPETCRPLQNIFLLAGISDIAKEFDNADKEDGNYQNLLDRVSTVVTENFAKKWKDLKNIKITLAPNGSNIDIQVKEAVRYNFEDRSDGFKRFVSILLMLSTAVECGEIEDAIILIDEPDNSLYPTGARYLKETLLNLAQKNVVVYSTHSPFMIDKRNIGRHIIVTKNNSDITETEVATESKYSNDEVLLNAIGTSSFEHIKDYNIIFEGWSDCEFFQKAIKSTKHKDIIRKIKDLGTAYSHGCTSIEHITPLLMLAEKNILIFTDSDKPSLDAKEKYKNDNGYQKENWFSFADLGGEKDETIEDYVNNTTLIQNAIDSIGCGKNIADKGEQKVMKFLGDLPREQKNAFKSYLIQNLTAKDIKDEYFTRILKNLGDKIPE